MMPKFISTWYCSLYNHETVVENAACGGTIPLRENPSYGTVEVICGGEDWDSPPPNLPLLMIS